MLVTGSKTSTVSWITKSLTDVGATVGKEHHTLVHLHPLALKKLEETALGVFVMIQQVLAEPEWQNRLTEVDLRALSPLRWRHVNPYGTFTLNMQECLPLEQVAQLPRATLPKFGASLP